MTDYTARDKASTALRLLSELIPRVDQLENNQQGQQEELDTQGQFAYSVEVRLDALKQRITALEQAPQVDKPPEPAPRLNFRFRKYDLVSPIDCPDPMSWIGERIYEAGKADATADVIRRLANFARLNDMNGQSTVVMTWKEVAQWLDALCDGAEQ